MEEVLGPESESIFYDSAGDRPLQTGKGRRHPSPRTHGCDLRAARRQHHPRGTKKDSEGEGHQGRGARQVLGRQDYLPSAAQRPLRNRRSTGELSFILSGSSVRSVDDYVGCQ